MRSTPVLLATMMAALAAASPPPSAEIVDGKIYVHTRSLNALRDGLSVVVATGTEEEIAARPAVLGTWDGTTFTPKYPLKAGTKYRVLGAGGGKVLEVTTPAAPPEKPVTLTHVYPNTTELPANVLRFYLHFSGPMRRGDAYQHLQVRDADGKAVSQPFLEIDAELWNEDLTRLTLLIDPGRIKQEVKPRLDLGPVFHPGRKYTLHVSGKWPTSATGTLGKDFTRELKVVEPVTTAIDPRGWRIEPAQPGPGDLRVHFDRPMDRALALRCLTITGPDGEPVAGKARLGDDDRTFVFCADWAPGTHQIVIGDELEDVCGNRNGQPFEVDLAKPVKKGTPISGVDFRVKSK